MACVVRSGRQRPCAHALHGDLPSYGWALLVPLGQDGEPAVLLGQYLQISRGRSPTAAGLLILPMVAGLLRSSTVSGSLVSCSGRWKGHLVAGSLLTVGGFALLGTIDETTGMVLLSEFLPVLGVGIGMTMQNTVAARDLGAAGSAVAFFRTLGRTVGVAVLGAVLDSRVGELTAQGAAQGSGGAGLADLPPAVQALIAAAHGDVTGRILVVSAVVAVLAVVAVVFIREVALLTESGDERLRTESAG